MSSSFILLGDHDDASKLPNNCLIPLMQTMGAQIFKQAAMDITMILDQRYKTHANE